MSQPPAKVYRTRPGSVYLVNASVPHDGFNDERGETRYVAAMKCKIFKPMTWRDVVTIFEDLIIE